MNRPKKNKAINPTLPEDQQVDERNIIDVEESSEISIEDRIHLYWVENKALISGGVTLIALLIIVFNGLRIYKGHAEEKIQNAYTEAKANGGLESFAGEFSNKDLGGFAALTVADEFYDAGNFESAIKFYDKAADALENDLLAGRAKLGAAFSSFYAGDEAAGRSLMGTIAADATIPEAVRLEAAYHLAIDADVSGDESAFESYLAQITSSPNAGQWQQRMDFYTQQR